jgi:uncharacterized integral membrane protein
MKLSTLFVLVPVAVIAAILAVANREEVTFKLSPFAAGDSATAFIMPLFVLVFLSFLLGVLVGGATLALRRAVNARRKRIAAKDIANVLALDAGKRSAEPPPS